MATTERPLCVFAKDDESVDGDVYANQAGLEELRRAIDRVLAGEKEATFPIFQDGNWGTATVFASTHADFDCEEPRCECGCQDKYQEVEARYSEKPA